MWLAVSKIYIPAGVKLFGDIYPNSAQNLIKFLFLNGLESYQKINTAWGQLSIGRYMSQDNLQKLDNDRTYNTDFLLRLRYFEEHNIKQERIYEGPEECYNSKITGIELPPANYNILTKFNFKNIV